MPPGRSAQPGETLGCPGEAQLKRSRWRTGVGSGEGDDIPREIVSSVKWPGVQRSDIAGMEMVRGISAAERVGREPADVFLQALQALHPEVTVKGRVPHDGWGLGHSPEGEVLGHLQDSSLARARECEPRGGSIYQVWSDIGLVQ